MPPRHGGQLASRWARGEKEEVRVTPRLQASEREGWRCLCEVEGPQEGQAWGQLWSPAAQGRQEGGSASGRGGPSAGSSPSVGVCRPGMCPRTKPWGTPPFKSPEKRVSHIRTKKGQENGGPGSGC